MAEDTAQPAQIAPSLPQPTGSGMNASHVVAASALTADMTPILMWISHWPLQPLDVATAGAIAGLIAAVIGGGGIMAFRKKGS